MNEQMNNQTTNQMNGDDFFETAINVESTTEEEVVLTTSAELHEEAEQIKESSKDDTKFPFVLHYDPNQKDSLLSMLNTVGAVVESDDENGHKLAIKANMKQLAFIKKLDSIKRVSSHEGSNPFLSEAANAQTTPRSVDGNMTADATVMSMNEDDGIAVASVTDCPTNTSMATAQLITLESNVSGSICCPGAEQWFKFTTTEAGEYTIYTEGSYDTVGELYDETGYLTRVDDYAPCGKLNFRIIRELEANMTYYVRVMLNNNATGFYTLKATRNSLVGEVDVTPDYIVLESGKIYEVPTTPNYVPVSHHTLLPGVSVEVYPYSATEKKVVWYPEDTSKIYAAQQATSSGQTYQTIQPLTGQVGETTVLIKDKYDHGRNASCTVYLGGKPVTAVTLDKTNLTLNVGEEGSLIATVSPADATRPTLVWTSSDPSVASVDQDGVVTAKTGGTATITAAATDGSGVYGCCEVTCIIPSSTDSIGTFQSLSTLSYTPADAETGAPIISWVQFTDPQNGKYKIRFISKINNLYYKEVGYEIYSKFDDAAPVSNVISSNVAYRSFIAAGETISADEGYYFVLGVVDNIPENTVASFKIVPYAMTLDGAYLRGNTTLFSCKDAQTINYVPFGVSENVEYHLLCNGDSSKALRVGFRNVLEFKFISPVRGERLSYWNRQKWVVKSEGESKKIYTKLDKTYCLINIAGKAHVSNNATNDNSEITITPYGNDGNSYTINLTNQNLYLTLVYGNYQDVTGLHADCNGMAAYWCEWKEYNDLDPSNQVWQFVEQPANNHYGVDTYGPIDNDVASTLKNDEYDFVIRYYTSLSEQETGKLLKATEVSTLHNANLKIVSVYQDYGNSISDFSIEKANLHAERAMELAEELGQPPESVIYFAVDYSPLSDELNTLAQYFSTIKNKLSGKYRIGVYGTAEVCDLIKPDFASHSWLSHSIRNKSNSIEGDPEYISYDSQLKYDIKQAEEIFYNNQKFDYDTAIGDDFGRW